LGIPDYQQSVLSRAQADMLLNGAGNKDITAEERLDKLTKAAKQAVLNYGPIYGPRAFREAVGHRLSGDKNKDLAAQLADEAVTADHSDLMRQMQQPVPADDPGFFSRLLRSKPARNDDNPYPAATPESIQWLARDPANRWKNFSDTYGYQTTYDVLSGKKKPPASAAQGAKP
jgi:hypothetical protein